MEPKTKLQKRVVELSKKLPPITEAQKQWARENIYKPTGYLRTKTIWCLECGKDFETSHELCAQLLGAQCTYCGAELKVTRSRKRSSIDKWYYTIFDRSKEMQVLRHFIVKKTCKVGSPAEVTLWEVVQNWISPTGEVENMARMTLPFSMYYDLWAPSSSIELRGIPSEPAKYDIYSEYIYPGKKIIPELRRNGFRGGLHGISPCKLLPALLKNPEIETLLKARQYSLMQRLMDTYMYSKINEYWPSIKICIRNNYIVKDGTTYLDYIDMLRQSNRDLHNAHYVCPVNLKEAHDRCVEKDRRRRMRLELEELKEKTPEKEHAYREFIDPFLDVLITDGVITITPLKSVAEFIEESDELRHCLFSNSYFEKTSSLLLSAKIDDRRVETVEFSLNEARVVQCRGFKDKNTKFHDRIVELVNSNSRVITERRNKPVAV